MVGKQLPNANLEERIAMAQLTAEEIDGLLNELNNKDRNKRALAASKLGKANSSQDVIIAALQQMIANERDDLVKGIAKSSIQSLIDAKTLHGLQDDNPEVKGAALAEIGDEQLQNKHIISAIEQMAATGENDIKLRAQALLIKRQDELTQQQVRQESVATSLPSNKYPALRTIAGFYRILAFVAGGFAVISAVDLLGDSILFALLSLIAGAVAVISLLAIAEGIHVLIDIEANTRQGR